MEFFLSHPNKDIDHPQVVDWVTKEFKARTGKTFRDPDRAIRLLHQQGVLIKVSKGVYKYDPKYVAEDKTLQDFSPDQKEQIYKLGNYKCAVCGLGRSDGMEIHADHIKPKEFGGTNDISNGQVLCSRHNFLKKTFKQSETGKRFFINLYESLKDKSDPDSQLYKDFVIDLLKVYDKYGINGHIKFKK